MSKEDCYFCHGGERFIPDVHAEMDRHVKNEIKYSERGRVCMLCQKIYIQKVVGRELGIPS